MVLFGKIVTEHKNGKYQILSIIEIDKLGKPKYVLSVDGNVVKETRDIADFENNFNLEFTKSIQSNKPM